jgi:shikimate kinase / 3-dehydroquinate synthase
MRHLVLSGFMATGKTTLGPRVAGQLGWPFVDTDDAIEVAAGKSVAAIWQGGGEGAFRAIEARVVEELLGRSSPHVIALGGGVVAQRELRRLAQERACLVTLEASPETIDTRIGDASSRPSLAGHETRSRIAQLLEARAEAYAECHATVATDRLTPDEAALAVLAGYRRDSVLVPLGKRSYTVDVVRDAPERLTTAIERLSPTRVIVVTDAVVERARGAALEAALGPIKAPVHRVALPAGEVHKTLASVEVIWSAALGAGADRKSVVLAYGGGVVCDLAGFAASTLFRGVVWVASPTTLLGMVDAAVGGKTGFDFASGKNLVGSFHQPSGVVCDVGHLATLPTRERTAGLAEVVKIALVADAELLARLETVAPLLARGDVDALLPVVRRAVELKARLVASDERDTGARALLNVGHTAGHALEAHGGFTRRLHGEAVAIGMAIELAAAERLGLTGSSVREAAERVLRALGLPTKPAPSEIAEAWGHATMDKKRAGTEIDWPIVSHAGEGRVVRITMDRLRQAILGDREDLPPSRKAAKG